MRIKLSNISVLLIIIGSLVGLLVVTVALNKSINVLLLKEIERVGDTLINDNNNEFIGSIENINTTIQRVVTTKPLMEAIEKENGTYIIKSLLQLQSQTLPTNPLLTYIKLNGKADSYDKGIIHWNQPINEYKALVAEIEQNENTSAQYNIIDINDKLYLVFSGEISAFSAFKTIATLHVAFSLRSNSYLLSKLKRKGKVDCLMLAKGFSSLASTSTGSKACLSVLKQQILTGDLKLLEASIASLSTNKDMLFSAKQLPDYNLSSIHLLVGKQTNLFEIQQQHLKDIIYTVVLALGISAIVTSVIATKIIKPNVKKLTDHVLEDFNKNTNALPSSIIEIDEFIDIAKAHDDIKEQYIKEGRERLASEREKILLSKQLRSAQAHKMEALGALAAGIAHDFNNLLTIIKNNIEIIEMSKHSKEITKDSVKAISFASNRGSSLIQELMLYVRGEKVEPKALNLNELVTSISSMIPSLVNQNNIEVVMHIEKETIFTVKVDKDKFSVCLINLIVNAKDAITEGGNITITLCSLDQRAVETMFPSVLGDTTSYCLLEVADTGHGIDERDLNKIFEPFFTTKDIGKGTGIGLSIVYELVKESKGYIKAVPNADLGTKIQLVFPLIS